MLVSVTGGISRAVGGLWALEGGTEVWGTRPVRTMGGCRRVDMAMHVSDYPRSDALNVPFRLVSCTPCQLNEVSSVPPTECVECVDCTECVERIERMELAVEPFRR